MLTAPFPRRHLADPFGDWPQWRKDMGLGPHRGADWNGLDAGTPIPASGAGRVVWRTTMTDAQAERTALGHQIQIAYPVTGGEIRIGYSHLHRSPTLRVGDEVRPRQAVGLLGDSGTASTGAHLHMTASWTTGDPGWIAVVDPMQFLTFASSPAGPGASIIHNEFEKEPDMAKIIMRGEGKPEWSLVGPNGDKSGCRFTTVQETANAWARIYGPAVIIPTREEYARIQAEARAIAATWR